MNSWEIPVFHDKTFGDKSIITCCSEWLKSPSSSQGPVCTREAHLFGERLVSVVDGTNSLLLLFQIGITLQPVALHRNMYASVVEDMILKVGTR
jgi:hypothetical protein